MLHCQKMTNSFNCGTDGGTLCIRSEQHRGPARDAAVLDGPVDAGHRRVQEAQQEGQEGQGGRAAGDRARHPQAGAGLSEGRGGGWQYVMSAESTDVVCVLIGATYLKFVTDS